MKRKRVLRSKDLLSQYQSELNQQLANVARKIPLLFERDDVFFKSLRGKFHPYGDNFMKITKKSKNTDKNSQRLEKIIQQRESIYGDPEISHKAIGLAWEGIFRNRYQELDQFLSEPGTLFPAELVAMMLATFKNVRAVRPIFHTDSFDDAHVYLGFSEKFRSDKEK